MGTGHMGGVLAYVIADCKLSPSLAFCRAHFPENSAGMLVTFLGGGGEGGSRQGFSVTLLISIAKHDRAMDGGEDCLGSHFLMSKPPR